MRLRVQRCRRCGTDESLAALQRQLDHARQDLIEAYDTARAARYQLGSGEMLALQHAERRHERTRSRWQDRYNQDRYDLEADPAGQDAGDAPSRADVTIDLTAGQQWIDLDGTRPPANGQSRPEQRPGR